MGKNKTPKKKAKKPDPQVETLNAILQAIINQNDLLKEILENVKKEPEESNEQKLARIRKAVENGQMGHPLPGLNPIYKPMAPLSPTIIAESNSCGTCGINFGTGGWGYVCTRNDCPSNICYNSSEMSGTTQKLDIKDILDNKCECGANPICMCV